MIEVFQVCVTVATVIFAIISFVKEKIPAHVTALIVMAILLITGTISTENALSVFSNQATATIAGMFIISAALKHTGLIDVIGDFGIQLAKKNFWLAIILFFGMVLILSAFMNNTPIVIIMTPVVIMMTKQLHRYPSKYLIPLSYVAILGGSCTIIGTSTNILVSGIVENDSSIHFNIFSITIPGLMMAAAGITFLAIFGSKLLPIRPLFSSEMFSDNESHKHFFAEAIVLPDSKFVGKSLDELHFPTSHNLHVIDIIRNDELITVNLDVSKTRRPQETKGKYNLLHQHKLDKLLRQITLKPYDRLLIRSNKKSLFAIKELEGINIGEHPSLSELKTSEETVVLEGIVGPGSRLINHKLNNSWIRRLYNCHIWALHRRGQIIHDNFSDAPIKFGDIILIEGTPKQLESMFKAEEILSLSNIKKRPFKKRSILALLTIFAVVILAAFNIMPIASLALIGATFLIATKCITPQQAYEAIDWRILLLIFGMLALSIAMQKTHIAEYAVHSVADIAKEFGPKAILATVYLATTILTELMTNNAVAVLLTPLVLALTSQLGLNPTPYIVAVMFAASSSFATPLGYQTNTYIYNAGNYRFTDFLKIGIPMNIIMVIAATYVIPMFWPLQLG
jgi:di/tricarboxylate transporter